MSRDKFSYIICSLITISLLTNIKGAYIKECSSHEHQCRADLLRDGEKIKYDVSCDCTPDPGTDVSKLLVKLAGNMCISKIHNTVQLEESSLMMKKCDVTERTFPLLLLHDLKNSKKFSISIEDAGIMRLRSKSILNNFPNMEINAEFKNSTIYGMGTGWFSNSSYVRVKMEHCTLDVIEAHFMADYLPNAEIHLTMETTDVLTIKERAFVLPSNSTVRMSGGSVGQWEGFAFRGGKSLHLEAMKIAHLQERAVNIYGMEMVSITASIFASVDKKVLFENVITRSRNDLDTKNINHPEKVIITKNKFINYNNEAFSGLCWEDKLLFNDNFIIDVNPKPMLKTKMCSKKRNWDAVANKNFIKCEGCFSDDNLDEQTCSFYRSAFCLCGNKHEVESFRPYGSTQIPCSLSLYHHLNTNCPHDSGEIIYKCKITPQEVTHLFSNRTSYAIGAGAVTLYYNTLLFSLISINSIIKLVFSLYN